MAADFRGPSSSACGRSVARASNEGFSLVELLIATTIMLIISGVVTTGLMQLTTSRQTISNRTELHAGVRSATELLQQEIGQAGRVALPGTTTLSAAVVANSGATQTVGLTMNVSNSTSAATCGIAVNVASASVCGVFANEYLTIDAGANAETVQATAVDTGAKQITAIFTKAHNAGASINVYGGFASGIVPDTKDDGTAYPNGSDGSHLKMYGDINGDGNMVYVEYYCDTAGGNLYRNVMPYNQAAPKPADNQASQILLSGITTNPGGTACFTYMPRATGPDRLAESLPINDSYCACNQTFVLDVAITLTVNTQLIDPITRKVETETKALLNVSPRNVFNAWQLASADWPDSSNRIQPMPQTVQLLLP